MGFTIHIEVNTCESVMLCYLPKLFLVKELPAISQHMHIYIYIYIYSSILELKCKTN